MAAKNGAKPATSGDTTKTNNLLSQTERIKRQSLNSDTIVLLCTLSESIVEENKRIQTIDKYVSREGNSIAMGKLDRALLYYWSASRYYEIASMYQESIHCIERIARLIENYLSLMAFKKSHYELDKWAGLLDNLFVHASKMVGRQYDNFDMAEIHEFKWLLHLEHTDDIDLTNLTQFPNLQSLLLLIVRSKLLLYRMTDVTKSEEYIKTIYNRIAPPLRQECTFKSEVEINYTKAVVNRIVFIGLIGKDFIQTYRNSRIGESVYYHAQFFENLIVYLNYNENKNFETELFGIKGKTKSRLDLLDNIVFDSLVCLYNVIKILPPHNQITTFSNSFLADVYNGLWEWSKYYEMLYNLYFYYRCYCEEDEKGKDKIVNMINRFSDVPQSEFKSLLNKCAKTMKEGGIACKDDFGYRYSKLFMNLRHEMDDATLHHIYTNYSAEMAVKYYRAARGINSEGMEYKNLIYGMYVLDDDLRNDTCQSNLADERYLINSGSINLKRKQIQKMYEGSNINKIRFYENKRDDQDPRSPYTKLQERYKDSPFINTEY